HFARGQVPGYDAAHVDAGVGGLALYALGVRADGADGGVALEHEQGGAVIVVLDVDDAVVDVAGLQLLVGAFCQLDVLAGPEHVTDVHPGDYAGLDVTQHRVAPDDRLGTHDAPGCGTHALVDVTDAFGAGGAAYGVADR